MERGDEAIVCGAGAAGLATAACLKLAGARPRVLERGDGVGQSWRGRYDGLFLNTVGWMSSLPGFRASPRRYGRYPTRERWVEYLEEYARRHDLEIELGVEVERIDRAGEGWRVETSEGTRAGRFAVVAVGYDHDPWIPEWPGRDGFEGELLHAARFRNAKAFEGREVLVVGAGNTGSEVATFLARGGAGRVRIAMRTPPNIFPRDWLGTPLNLTAVALDRLPPRMADGMARMTQRMIYGDLSEHGLPFPELGVRRSLDERRIAPAIDAGFVDAVKRGRIELLPTIERFEGRDVVLLDGTRIQPDAVIAATGYGRGLEPLVGHLGVLDERGVPRDAFEKRLVEQPHAPGLFFCGYRSRVSGQLRQMRFEAKQVARIARKRMEAGPASGPAAVPA